MRENVETFNTKSDDYARYRPRYPESWYKFLFSCCPSFERALDCGTGNGQVAIDLARKFSAVLAIDSSAEQIQHAFADPKITYRTCRVEDLTETERTFDLVTAAQSLHWFDLEKFYPAVIRQMKPGAIFAAWGYHFFTIDPVVDRVVTDLFLNPIDPYWSEANRLLWAGYRTIPFPFTEMKPPAIILSSRMTQQQLLAYLGTWSALKRYESLGNKAIEPLREALPACWPEKETKVVSMKLQIRVGRLTGAGG